MKKDSGRKVKGFAFLSCGEIELIKNSFEENPPWMYVIFPTKTGANREMKNWEIEEEIAEVSIHILPANGKAKIK